MQLQGELAALQPKSYELALRFLGQRQRGETTTVDKFLADHPGPEPMTRTLLEQSEGWPLEAAIAAVEHQMLLVTKSATWPEGAAQASAADRLDGLDHTRDGELFDHRYRIVRPIGHGGFGEVYLVEDTLQDAQLLALKIVRSLQVPAAEFERRFRTEIRILRGFSHPDIPQIFNDGRTEAGEIYYTMTFVDGLTLESALRECKTLPLARALQMLHTVLGVLDYAHKKGIVHRDLKPGNLMVVGAGSRIESVRVLDFGIAKVLGADNPMASPFGLQTQNSPGTPLYMAPEQRHGQKVDTAADMYALGLIAHRMLLGHLPLQHVSPFEMLPAKAAAAPPPIDSAVGPTWLRRWIRRCLTPDPMLRPKAEESLLIFRKALRSRDRVFAPATLALGAVVATAIVCIAWKILATATPGGPIDRPEVRDASAITKAPGESSPAAAPLAVGKDQATIEHPQENDAAASGGGSSGSQGTTSDRPAVEADQHPATSAQEPPKDGLGQPGSENPPGPPAALGDAGMRALLGALVNSCATACGVVPSAPDHGRTDSASSSPAVTEAQQPPPVTDTSAKTAARTGSVAKETEATTEPARWTPVEIVPDPLLKPNHRLRIFSAGRYGDWLIPDAFDVEVGAETDRRPGKPWIFRVKASGGKANLQMSLVAPAVLLDSRPSSDQGGDNPRRDPPSIPFLMDIYEVSEIDFNAVCSGTEVHPGGASQSPEPIRSRGGVTIAMATEFAKNLELQLPTVQEWLFAANEGADGRRFPWGDRFDPSKVTVRRRNERVLRNDTRHDVGRFGVYGLASGLKEWCQGEKYNDAQAWFLCGGSSVQDMLPPRYTWDRFWLEESESAAWVGRIEKLFDVNTKEKRSSTGKVSGAQPDQDGFRCILRLYPRQ